LARCLIIGCGCRGRSLARALSAGGYATRGTTRDPGNRGQIEAAGAEPLVGDPNLVGTLAGAFEHVSVACILLGSAIGSAEQVTALHSSRLKMLLARMLDTTVRGVVYEAAGSVDPAVLRTGATILRETCERSSIPYVLLVADPRRHASWLKATGDAVEQLVRAR
jgi:Trk K+ transport system NAD-binding subunit